MIYLDWASTTPPDSSLLTDSVAIATEFFGNPSSRHALGQAARARFEDSRRRLEALLGGQNPTQARPAILGGAKGKAGIIFTSGGSEADAIVLLSLLRRKDSRSSAPPHLVTTLIEHSAVFEQAKLLEGLGIPVSYIAPESDGRVSPAKVAASIRKETALVAVMAVNNETGAIQPLAEIAASLREASRALGRPEAPFFHVDAVQALGKIAFEPEGLGIGSAAFSAHKIRGPRGVGALWLKGRLEPLVLGGGQENGLRPGTENLQGAFAFTGAAEASIASLESRREKALALEARLISGLKAIPGALPLPLGREAGDPCYSPFILSLAFPGLAGEVFERALADSGIAVSTGSACSSHHHGKGRRVLDAMGLEPELSFSAIRVSTGELTTENDIDAFLETSGRLYGKLKA